MKIIRLLTCTLITLVAFIDSANADDTSHIVTASENTLKLIPFTAHYKTEMKLGWFSIGVDAQRTLKQKENGYWEMRFRAETGAASLTETSDFVIEDNVIRPLDYRYRATGLFNEDDRTLEFIHEHKQVKDHEKDHIHQQAWQQEVHDNQTYMLQAGWDLSLGKSELDYPVFEKSRTKSFRFKRINYEVLDTDAGKISSVKIQQIRDDQNREIYAWYATEPPYLLLKLVDWKKGKKRYEINISDFDIQ